MTESRYPPVVGQEFECEAPEVVTEKLRLDLGSVVRLKVERVEAKKVFWSGPDPYQPYGYDVTCELVGLTAAKQRIFYPNGKYQDESPYSVFRPSRIALKLPGERPAWWR